MTSGGHGLQIRDDYSKQECLVLTPTMISLKQKYFSDLPYPRYQLKHSSGPMMVASCWSGQKEDICPSIKKSMTRPAVLQCFFKDSRSSILRHEFRDISPGFIERIDNSLSLINLIYARTS